MRLYFVFRLISISFAYAGVLSKGSPVRVRIGLRTILLVISGKSHRKLIQTIFNTNFSLFLIKSYNLIVMFYFGLLEIAERTVLNVKSGGTYSNHWASKG